MERLRRLHEELDRAVLGTYGWGDLAGKIPSYCGDAASAQERKAAEQWEGDVVDRLFALNAARAEQERLLGLGKGAGGKGKAGKGAVGKSASAGKASKGKASKGAKGAVLPGMGEESEDGEES